MRGQFLFIIIAVALFCAAGGLVAAASVTQSVTYQGTLTDSSGNPLTGTYSMTFQLYNVTSGGSALGTDTHSVTVKNGLFTTPVTFDSVFFNGQALWLGIKIGSDPEMTPRQEIRPVPYALNLAGGVIDQVLAVVTDIQTKMNTVITKLNTIDTKLNAPPKPIRYEYYTDTIDRPDQTVYTELHLFNWGDAPAHVSQYHYKLSDYDPHWELIHTRTDTISPQTGGGSFAVIGVLPTDHYRLKVMTDSPYVAIDVPFTYANDEVYKEYLTGDLLKVEIYS